MHMQQQGYGLAAIAAGLCHGVAQNIAHTLFHGVELIEPVVVVGGVSFYELMHWTPPGLTQAYAAGLR